MGANGILIQRGGHDQRSMMPWVVIVATFAMVLMSGFIAPQRPSLVLPVVGIAALASALTLREHIVPFFLAVLGLVLAGYVFQGKSFAYVGLPPLYVSELALLLGLATLLIGRMEIRVRKLEFLVLLFMGLGAIRTVPYISRDGLYALRDAATWYYAAFALLVSFMFTAERWIAALGWLQRLMTAIVIWFAIMPILFRFLPAHIPALPGSPVPVLAVTKPGDRAVLLTMLAAFVITGLASRVRPARAGGHVFWGFWLVGAFMVAAWNRGGLLAILVGMLMLALLTPSREWLKPITIGALALSLLFAWNPMIETGGYRPLSAQQLAVNFVSIFSDDTENLESVQGTKDWRLNWWSDIYEQVVSGDEFWTGKGFGANLANEYGYQTDDRDSLRSPHNVHMTILARMGVPGLALWAALQLTFANTMLRAFRAARRRGDRLWQGTFAMILVTWLAALVNSSFDVYLEGPQGAIPFWCLLGVGLGALRQPAQARERPEAVIAHES